MTTPERTLRTLDAVHSLAVVGAGIAVTVTIATATLLDASLAEPLTVGTFLGLAAAIALGYLAAGLAETVTGRLLAARREAAEDAIDAARVAAFDLRGEVAGMDVLTDAEREELSRKNAEQNKRSERNRR